MIWLDLVIDILLSVSVIYWSHRALKAEEAAAKFYEKWEDLQATAQQNFFSKLGQD